MPKKLKYWYSVSLPVSSLEKSIKKQGKLADLKSWGELKFVLASKYEQFNEVFFLGKTQSKSEMKQILGQLTTQLQ